MWRAVPSSWHATAVGELPTTRLAITIAATPETWAAAIEVPS